MNVRLEQINDAIQFRAQAESGYDVTIASADGQEGARPMELVAISLGGCSSIDVLSILEKQRQTVDAFEVDVKAERATDRVPAVFTALHLHYRVEGEVEPEKMRRAVNLSLETYCSVSHMLAATASISYAFTVNGTDYDGHVRQPKQ